MNFLRDNRELIFLYSLVIGLLVGSIALGPAVRMGQESAFAHHSVREVVAGIARAR